MATRSNYGKVYGAGAMPLLKTKKKAKPKKLVKRPVKVSPKKVSKTGRKTRKKKIY